MQELETAVLVRRLLSVTLFKPAAAARGPEGGGKPVELTTNMAAASASNLCADVRLLST